MVLDKVNNMSNNKQRPIGVFDSGVGGLTNVRALMERLPMENIVYFGDTARVPYGVKSRATIETFTAQIVEFLLQNDVKALVIACNTIAAVAGQKVRAMAGNMPVLDVITAGAEAALATTRTNHIGVMATSTTVNSNAYARAIVQPAGKPDVDAIFGIPPTVAIEQRLSQGGRKSTVATVTEIYHYLRLLYARAGTPHCPNCHRPVERQSAGQIADTILSWPEGARIEVLAPLVRGRKGEFKDLFESARKQGFVRAVVDGTLIELSDPPTLNRRVNHDVSVVVDRLVVRLEDRGRLADSVETVMQGAFPFLDITAPIDALAVMLTPENPAVLVRDFKTDETWVITRSDVIQALS